jgi:4-hydroxy-3-methylbut-2-enyl diphosphate reductase
MKVYLGTPRGFCAGVVRAIEIVENAIEKFGAPIYIKHEIVHNKYVVQALGRKGAITVEDVDDIPNGSSVIFSAHGSPPSDFDIAKQRNLRVIDATCPLVTKVHNEAKKYRSEGRKVVYVGHAGHQETKGTMGQMPMHLLDDQNSSEIPDWDKSSPIAVLTQTTLSKDDTDKSVKIIKNKFDDVVIRNDICYATTNRQDAVKRMCKLVDLILVIGSENSSNCERLTEVARARNIESYRIGSAEEILDEWIVGVDKIGITSGASTPEDLVNEVVAKLKPDDIEIMKGPKEDFVFVMPPELR